MYTAQAYIASRGKAVHCWHYGVVGVVWRARVVAVETQLLVDGLLGAVAVAVVEGLAVGRELEEPERARLRRRRVVASDGGRRQVRRHATNRRPAGKVPSDKSVHAATLIAFVYSEKSPTTQTPLPRPVVD